MFPGETRSQHKSLLVWGGYSLLFNEILYWLSALICLIVGKNGVHLRQEELNFSFARKPQSRGLTLKFPRKKDAVNLRWSEK